MINTTSKSYLVRFKITRTYPYQNQPTAMFALTLSCTNAFQIFQDVVDEERIHEESENVKHRELSAMSKFMLRIRE